MCSKLPCLNLYLAHRLRNYATYYCLGYYIYLFSIFFAPPCCYKLCIHQLIFILVSMILIFLYIVIIALGQQQQHSKHHFGSQLIGAVVRGGKCSKAKNCLPKYIGQKTYYAVKLYPT